MENWSGHELAVLGRIGNKRNNSFWNEKKIPFPFDPDDKDSLVMWLRDKYTGKFRYGSVTDADYNLDDSWADRTDDYGFDNNRSRSSSTGGGSLMGRRLSSALGLNYVGPTRRRQQSASASSSGAGGSGHYDDYDDSTTLTRSMRRGRERNEFRGDYDDDYDSGRSRGSRSAYDRPPPRDRDRDRPRGSSRYSSPTSPSRPARLTFRRPSSTEFRKYGDQSRKMKFDMGYEDEDVNVEALALAHGNINKAIEIIKQSGVNPADHSADRPSSSSSAAKATPSLPQRKETSGAIFDSSKAGGFN